MPDLELRDLENYAEVLFWAVETSRREPFKNGDIVVIRYDVPALRLVETLYARLLDAHLRPVPVANPTPYMEAELYLNSSFGQLTFAPPGQEELYGAAAGVINVLAPDDLLHLSRVDPRTIAEGRAASRGLNRLLERRRRTGAMGWTMGLYPTEALAVSAGMQLAEYSDELFRACSLFAPEPVREWTHLKQRTDEIATWLDSLDIRRLRVESDNVDLFVTPGDNRRFVGITGSNIPGYEVYVAPDWRGTEGVFFADQASLELGHLVQGVRLEFAQGVAAQVSAVRGQSFLHLQLYADGGARRVGEFSLTDRRMSRVRRFMAHTLLDENHGGEWGNCHIALGAALPASFSGPPEILDAEMEAALGLNSSSIHWDLVNTERKRVTALLPGGGMRTVYEDGEFAV